MKLLLMSLLLLNHAMARKEMVCEMLIVIDQLLLEEFHNGIQEATEFAKSLVSYLNDIIRKHKLMAQISFQIGEIRLVPAFCLSCNNDDLLKAFSKMQTSMFCLAHLLTFRDFPDGLVGYAYRKGICTEAHNSGFTSILNHGDRQSLTASSLTFVHEVGHNMGAEHDEGANCRGKYIMSVNASDATQFSFCSIQAINYVIAKEAKCLQKSLRFLPSGTPNDLAICGDLSVQGDEECDCGIGYETCTDPCCYPSLISPGDLALNQSARPCRRHTSPLCLHPYRSAWTFGILYPWLFIGLLSFSLSLTLLISWKFEKNVCIHY